MAVAVDIAGFAGVSFSVLTASVEEGTGGAGAAVAGAAVAVFFAGFARFSFCALAAQYLAAVGLWLLLWAGNLRWKDRRVGCAEPQGVVE